jgi:NADPH:quinone reductase-like Zn-dependent oxidoreductase
MKAIRYHEHGGSDVLKYEEVERPVPGPGQVLVKVAGGSFNPIDAMIRAGYVREIFPIPLPIVPGIDFSGTISEIGPGVEGRQVGDAVMGLLDAGAAGTAAEYVVAPAETVADSPRTVDLADAAALPAGGLTAWQALFEYTELQAGQTILINGAGGAVGGFAVQLAKAAGAVVTATASERSAERLRSYGADRIIDHRSTPVTEAGGGPYDIVLNLVRTAPEATAGLLGLVADGGVLASTTGPAPEDTARKVRGVQVFAHGSADQLGELAARVDAGTLKIHVAGRRPLADLAAVHGESDAGKLAGKTVFVPA